MKCADCKYADPTYTYQGSKKIRSSWSICTIDLPPWIKVELTDRRVCILEFGGGGCDLGEQSPVE